MLGGAEETIDCEKSQGVKVQEGNVGQTAQFPWIGLLKVHLHEAHSDKFRIAVTGVILIKENFALAVSSDVAKIPKHILKDDSKIVFITELNTPIYVKVKDIINHPEFEVLTLNTITLIEIEVSKEFKGKPICWPRPSFNTKGDLYTVGYTDVNKVVEKEIFKQQFIDKTFCDEFYIRSNLNEDLKPPTRYQCAFAVHNNASCIVENGMAVVSNATGYWTLIGLSVHGPGCAAPNRFIELSTFLPWLTTTVTLPESDVIPDDDGPDLKLMPDSAQFSGFRRQDKDRSSNVIPVHALFGRQQLGSSSGYGKPRLSTKKPRYYVDHREIYGAHDYYEHHYYVPTWLDRYLAKHLKVDYFGPGKAVIEFDTMLEYSKDSCRNTKDLMYNDIITITNNEINGMDEAVYGLSLFDLLYQNVSCIKVEIDSKTRDKVKVWHEPVFGVYPPKQRQPSELIREKYIPPIAPAWYSGWGDPHKRPTPQFIKEEILERNIPNVNIMIRFRYLEKAKMILQIYGEKKKKSKLILRDDENKLNLIKNLKKYKNVEKFKPKFQGANDVQRLFWSDENVDDMFDTLDDFINYGTTENDELTELSTEKSLYDNYTLDSKESYKDILKYNRGQRATSKMLLYLFVIGRVLIHNTV